jgi:hypothetical protein
MQTVVSELLDALWPLLSGAPRLTGMYDAGEARFVAELDEWLAAGEAVLNRHHRPQVAEIAGLRAQLRAASAGVIDIRYIRAPADAGGRKLHRAVAALLFNQAQAVLCAVTETFSAQRKEAEKYVRQMVALSLQKQLFYPAWDGGGSRSESLTRVWQTLMADGDTLAAGRHVLSIVSYPDALRMVDEVVTDWALR